MRRCSARRCFITLVIGLCATAVFSPAHAEASNLELAAMIGGRIVGAAKACGINGERIRRTSERMMSLVKARAATPAELQTARTYFSQTQPTGAEQIRAERSKCASIHVNFSELEVKLGRAPLLEGDRVAVKRGVPPLGALKPESAIRAE